MLEYLPIRPDLVTLQYRVFKSGKAVRIVEAVRCLIVMLACMLILTDVLYAQQVRVGVLAPRGVETAIQVWTPTIDYLSERIADRDFQLSPLDLHGMSAALEHGELDFILTNPGNYVDLEAGYGITRIATLMNMRHGKPSKRFGAVIFVHKRHSDIRTLADLKGKKFAAVDKDAFGGFQMAWRELRDAGIDPFRDFGELRFAGFPQDSIVFDVLGGKVDAGTVRTDVLEGMATQGLIKLVDFRILNQQTGDDFPFLHSTRLYPEWAFAKGRLTPDDLASEVAIALLQMPAVHTAAQAGGYAGWTVPLTYQPVHDLFRELEIGPYARTDGFTLADVVRRYWYWLALLVLAVLLSMSFNILVKRQVLRRTAELTREVSERKRAEDESRKLLDENRFLINKSLAVQEDERHHLARELHDELGQCIAAIQADARIIGERAPACDSRLSDSATAIQEVASHIYEVVHSMMERLRPGLLDDLGLVDTLKEEIDVWRVRYPDTDFELRFDGELSGLGEEVTITLYRVVQECLTNIAKHAEARHVVITLGIANGSTDGQDSDIWPAVFLRIGDDGMGMVPAGRGAGLGLIGMRERVDGLGGHFAVDSGPGKGTTISIRLPLTPATIGA